MAGEDGDDGGGARWGGRQWRRRGYSGEEGGKIGVEPVTRSSNGEQTTSWSREDKESNGRLASVEAGEEEEGREAATMVMAAQHGGRQRQCWQRTMGGGRKGGGGASNGESWRGRRETAEGEVNVGSMIRSHSGEPTRWRRENRESSGRSADDVRRRRSKGRGRQLVDGGGAGEQGDGGWGRAVLDGDEEDEAGEGDGGAGERKRKQGRLRRRRLTVVVMAGDGSRGKGGEGGDGCDDEQCRR